MKGGERMKPRVVAIYNVEQANALFKNGAKVVGFKKYNNKIAILFEMFYFTGLNNFNPHLR